MKFYVLVNLLLLLWAKHAQAGRSPGDIYPSRLELEVGASANISCRMNRAFFRERSSADLYFVDTQSKERVPDAQIVRLNSTTIVYKLEHATEQETTLICKCGDDAIMEAKLFVGTAPQLVQDFNCLNYDFEYMICNFTQPSNPVLTQYNLSYFVDSPSYDYFPVCNYEAKPLVVCNTTFNDKTSIMHFILRASNSLGGPLTQPFNVSPRDVAIPAAPGAHFYVLDLTADTLAVTWRLPHSNLYRSKSLQWEVHLQPDGAQILDLSQAVTVVRLRTDEFSLRIVELPYAYYWYKLRLRVKVRSSVAAGRSDMWSKPFTYRFQTAARSPDRPPRTNVGSFYVESSETRVRLYWEQLELNEYNGVNFTYTVSEVRMNGEKIKLQPLEMELNSALFAWQKDAHYEFDINSQNHMGLSRNSSRIEVFPFTQKIHKRRKPPAIHNVYHESNRTYTLTWEEPEQATGLLNYTVYWCDSKRASQNECKGSIHFQQVKKGTLTFTTAPQSTQQEHPLNLAVSANYVDYNTGMHWAPCSMDVNSELVKMQPEVQAISAQALKVQWGLEHICLSILAGYNITYCELENSNASTCAPGTTQFLKLDKSMRKTEITNLKPFTLYNVQMYMYSNIKVGKISDPVHKRTAEAAPSAPRQVRVDHIRNTSAVVSWLPPSQSNGHVRYYTITCNEHVKRLEVNSSTDGTLDFDNLIDAQGRISYTLHDLISFMSYKVYVTAHTVADSAFSNDVHFTTLVGFPSFPGPAMSSLDSHNGSTLIKWSKPAFSAGRLEYYEVLVTLMRHEQVLKRCISVVLGATECLLEIPACPESDLKTTFKVRAVNAALLSHEVAESDGKMPWEESVQDMDDVDNHEPNQALSCVGGQQRNAAEILQRYRNPQIYRLYKSPWQLGPTYGCAENRMSEITASALIVMLCFVAMLGVCYAARKKYNKMANIHCTLPAGLDAYISKDGFTTADYLAAAGVQEALTAPSREYACHNEKHQLLDSMGNENRHTLVSSSSMEQHIPAAYLRTLSQSTAETYVDSLNETDVEMETPVSSAAALQRITEDEPYVQAVAAQHMYAAAAQQDGYIQPSKIMDWARQQQQITAKHNDKKTADRKDEDDEQQQQHEEEQAEQQSDNYQQQQLLYNTHPTSSGYVSVDSLHALQPKNTTSNGYVQPTQLQALLALPLASQPAARTATPAALTGYTSLEVLSKMCSTLNPAATEAQAYATNKPLSGYVTQRQLNALGQQQLN